MGQGWVATHLEAANVAEAEQDPRFDRTVDHIYRPDDNTGSGGERSDGPGCRALMAAPAVNGDGSLLAVLAVLEKRGGGAFTASDLSLLRLQARQV